MSKSGIVKYHIKLSCDVDGPVERADLIGAIFGQTEGLLGPEMNLNDLQRSSKVGRIDAVVNSSSNKTTGNVTIPMSTDIDTCALIAAGIESIDKVGPFDCSFKVNSIDDVRAAKKADIVKRAQEIKQRWTTKSISEGESMLNDLHHGGDSKKPSSYGSSRLACGPKAQASNWVILVEGRADVINLMRAGYDNAVEVNGGRVDRSIKDLCRDKDAVVAFLDGDRSGGFILREIKSLVAVDYELRADRGIEVEELTPQRIDDLLRPIAEKITSSTEAPKLKDEADKPLAEMVSKVFPGLNQTLEAMALDEGRREVFRVPISEVVSKLSTQSGIRYLLLDGIITQRLLDAARDAGIGCVVGHRSAKLTSTGEMNLRTFRDLGVS